MACSARMRARPGYATNWSLLRKSEGKRGPTACGQLIELILGVPGKRDFE
jgi:hypothetical protein